ncbi:hypothetical protein BJ944DRAFT_194635 [Cunninghamella echinulata]|nr:hypothetical protein BJ944DRAFT_194635 [Cunninghamella echinulata]
MLETAQYYNGNTDKKGRVSLNHLLSFSFPARQQQPAYTPRRTKTTSYQPYNKERFLNANYRFIVKATGNYIANTIEPDSSFDWDDIEQVLIAGDENPSCPICLSPPTAARVTKCGHIFCFNCILHYLELRDPKKQWRKCPICWESIYARDMKSVRNIHPFAVIKSSNKEPSSSSTSNTAITNNQSNLSTMHEGDSIELCLMQRSSKSTLAFPISDTWPINDDLVAKYHHNSRSSHLTMMPWHFTPDALLFGRFMLATPEYLLLENDRDIRELKDALKDAKEWGAHEDIKFIEQGLRQLLTEAEEISQLHLNKNLDRDIELAKQFLNRVKNEQHEQHVRERTRKSIDYSGKGLNNSNTTESSSSAVAVVDEKDIPEAYKQLHMQLAGSNDLPLSSTSSSSDKNDNNDNKKTPHLHQQHQQHQQHQLKVPTTEYYFYQAKDGQHIYLHPLDIKILKHEFGDYQDFPESLTVKSTCIQETSLTEDVRKKFKYLGHLPLSCEITFIEIDVKPLVSKDTWIHFQHELKLRNKKRQDRIKREEKARKIATIKQQQQQQQENPVQQEQQRIIENDPFFKTYQPISEEENEAMLKLALETSALEAQQYQQQQQQQQPKTVWGTPAIAATTSQQEEEVPQNWADHIVITQGRKKNKKKHK